LPTSSDGAEGDWRRQLAEAARRAADELADEDHPQLRQLHADLKELEARMNTEPAAPPEAD
jgi:hypothetical protein